MESTAAAFGRTLPPASRFPGWRRAGFTGRTRGRLAADHQCAAGPVLHETERGVDNHALDRFPRSEAPVHRVGPNTVDLFPQVQHLAPRLFGKLVQGEGSVAGRHGEASEFGLRGRGRGPPELKQREREKRTEGGPGAKARRVIGGREEHARRGGAD